MNKTFHIKWVFIQQGSIVLLTVLLQFYGKVMKTNFENQKPNIICHRKQFQQTLLQSLKYRKRPCISRTFFHKIEANTQGCSLSTDRSVFEVLKNLINIHTTSQDSQCQETYKKLRVCCCCSMSFLRVVAPTGDVCVYRPILLSNSFFKRLIFTSLEQLNTNLQGISIPTHRRLQNCRNFSATCDNHEFASTRTVNDQLFRCFGPPSRPICQLDYQAPVLHEVFRRLQVFQASL